MFRHEQEPVTFQRDVEAVMVPAGVPVTLRAGKTGFITQALGGSFTVYVEGNLFRIAGNDADALGKDPMIAPELPPNATDEDVRELVWDQMRQCYDPEIPINIVELGLVYECEIAHEPNGERVASIKMTLTAPGCGMGPVLQLDAEAAIKSLPGVEHVRVEVVFDPPWSRDRMSEVAQLQLGML